MNLEKMKFMNFTEFLQISTEFYFEIQYFNFE